MGGFWGYEIEKNRWWERVGEENFWFSVFVLGGKKGGGELKKKRSRTVMLCYKYISFSFFRLPQSSLGALIQIFPSTFLPS